LIITKTQKAMKRILTTTGFILSAVALYAQSPEQGYQQLYYERYGSAENTFHQLVQQNATNAEAWYGLTTSYIMEDKAPQALDAIRQAPASIADEPYFEVALGTALLQAGKKDSAAMYFEQALDQTKHKNAAILSAVAQAHINAGNGDANYAIDLLNRAIKRDKHNAALYTELGDAYMKLKNGSEAYKAYDEAIKQNDKYAAAYHKLGDIFLSQKNTDLYLQNYNKAVAADPNYAPSLYKLYTYYFYHDPAKALQYYNDYAAKSDHTIQNEYDLADLLYLNKTYGQAIQKAQNIMNTEGDEVKPRLYKLMAYSYAGQKDTTQAISYMQQYFANENDTNFVSKDFESMGDFYTSLSGKEDSAIAYYAKAVGLEKDSSALYQDYKTLADLSKSIKNYEEQAKWMGKYYSGNNYATNVDLFNWALADYLAHDFQAADTVFGLYTAKYPEQAFGYYWRARANVAIDTAMTEGLAIPHYQKLIEVLQQDSTNTNYKNWMTEAYAYLAAYEVNTNKDYAEAIDYFEKVLDVDPNNENAKKYISMLEKTIDQQENNSTEDKGGK
jgi:tetratricopeptide (TPR) repeat protein